MNTKIYLTLVFFSLIVNVKAQVNFLDEIKTKNHSVVAVAYSPNGNMFASAGYDQTIQIRSNLGELIKRIDSNRDVAVQIAFSADNKYIAGGGGKAEVYVWSVDNGTLVFKLKGHKKAITGIDISNKNIVASAGNDKKVILWDLATGNKIRECEGHSAEVIGVSFTADGNSLVSAGNDGSVIVWEGRTGAMLKNLSDNNKKTGAVTSVAFSPNGNFIASAYEKKIIIWDAVAGFKLREMEYKNGTILSMRFTPDSRFFITGSTGNEFVLWNVETATQMYKSEPQNDDLYSIAYSPDGNKLITADFSNRISIWDISALGIQTYLQKLNAPAQPPLAASQQAVPNTPAQVAQPLAKSDVDFGVPNRCASKKTNRYALIIGNEDYSSYQTGLKSESNVDFARNDASAFKKYAIQVMCVPDENIIYIEDAKAVEMHRAIEKINILTELSAGKAEVFVYYAGHGFPDEITKEPYLIPVDVSGSDLRFAIKLKDFYFKLTQHNPARVTVFLDACFSGGARNQGLISARGVKMSPKYEEAIGNIVVFSASSGQESSLPYADKQHGMFTYHLLKKLKDTKGEITYGQLADYIKDEVAKRSILINDKQQTPQTNVSLQVVDVWVDWTF